MEDRRDVVRYGDADTPPITRSEAGALSRLLRGKSEDNDVACKSTFEEDVRGLLRATGIRYLYEPVTLQIVAPKGGSGGLGYSPDFFTNMKIDGKFVIIEAKGEQFLSDVIMVKYAAFRKKYASRYHFIVITDTPQAILDAAVQRLGIDKFADEIWSTEKRDYLRKDKKGMTEEGIFILGKLLELRRRPEYHPLT